MEYRPIPAPRRTPTPAPRTSLLSSARTITERQSSAGLMKTVSEWLGTNAQEHPWSPQRQTRIIVEQEKLEHSLFDGNPIKFPFFQAEMRESLLTRSEVQVLKQLKIRLKV